MRSENSKYDAGVPKNMRSYYLEQMGIDTWIIRKPIEQYFKLWVIAENLEINSSAHGLLNKMLNSIGLLPEDMCLKATLSDKLIQDMNTNPPSLLLITGNEAAKYLLADNSSINDVRGKIHTCHNTPCVVSYHPDALLKRPLDKKSAYQDLLLVQQFLAQSS